MKHATSIALPNIFKARLDTLDVIFLTHNINLFPPDDALQKLAIFEGKYVRLKDERDNVAKAKEALELQDVSVNLVS